VTSAAMMSDEPISAVSQWMPLLFLSPTSRTWCASVKYQRKVEHQLIILLYDKRNASTVCVLSYISFAVILCMCLGTHNLGDGDTDRREILHNGTCTYPSRTCLYPFWGRYPQGIPKIQNFGRLKRRIYLKVAAYYTCHSELKISSTRAF